MGIRKDGKHHTTKTFNDKKSCDKFYKKVSNNKNSGVEHVEKSSYIDKNGDEKHSVHIVSNPQTRSEWLDGKESADFHKHLSETQADPSYDGDDDY